MRSNRIRERWDKGEAAVCAWLSIGNAYSAEIAGWSGVDSVLVDLQHGMTDVQAMIGMLQAISSTPSTPLVRVPSCDPPLLMKSLDAGAYGVICPMINSPQEARALVQYALYPPKGTRSNGPIRASTYGVAGSYQKTANDEILVIPMIETRQAVENIDAILDVPGISAIYVGPADLAFSLGKTPQLDSEDPEQLGMYEKILAACNKRGIYPGIHCGTPSYAARMIKMGFRLTTIANDSGLMAKAAREAVAGVWAEVGNLR